MKKITLIPLVVLSCLFHACWFNGQDDDFPEPPVNQSQYTPIIMSRTEFEASTVFGAAQTIVNSGKIYVKDQFLFINEIDKGFHVMDNSNPENPVNIGFLKLLGSSDLAIKNNVIYANNAVDLIAITPDFNTSTLEITKRLPNTFPQLIAPDGFQFYNLPDDQIIVGFTLNN